MYIHEDVINGLADYIREELKLRETLESGAAMNIDESMYVAMKIIDYLNASRPSPSTSLRKLCSGIAGNVRSWFL